MKSLQPNTVLLTTPHGLAASKEYLFYLNSRAKGYALLGQDLHNGTSREYKAYLEAAINAKLSQSLIEVTSEHGSFQDRNVSGLMAFADSEPIALRWGEVIPLSFLGQSVNGTKSPISTIVLSIPTRRYTQDVAMVGGLLMSPKLDES